ncbi:universal stress protein [Methylocapsa acidiphila]|uniref:universal stress protein n=1 Tax=Methylocapsa acidiphila TaxID=133552 RepID=UPI0003FFB43E|nr:universal stress protein [Methylocapsa acidiphila]
MFRKILVPIDAAEPTLAELGVFLAAQLTALSDGAVRMIHVFPEIPYSFQEFLPPHVGPEREKAVVSLFEDLAKKANIPEGRFTHILRTGAAYDEVLTEAEEWGADLIIIGSHNPSMSTYLLGSNAQKIVRHANCSVLVVRPHKEHPGAVSWLTPPFAS